MNYCKDCEHKETREGVKTVFTICTALEDPATGNYLEPHKAREALVENYYTDPCPRFSPKDLPNTATEQGKAP